MFCYFCHNRNIGKQRKKVKARAAGLRLRLIFCVIASEAKQSPAAHA
jgi:hypothetical protein